MHGVVPASQEQDSMRAFGAAGGLVISPGVTLGAGSASPQAKARTASIVRPRYPGLFRRDSDDE
jgi:hypothetical protein